MDRKELFDHILDYRSKGISVSQTITALNISKPTYYRLLKEFGQNIDSKNRLRFSTLYNKPEAPTSQIIPLATKLPPNLSIDDLQIAEDEFNKSIDEHIKKLDDKKGSSTKSSKYNSRQNQGSNRLPK